jgi:hypothetical protein
VASERIDPTEQIPEADLLEQQVRLDPQLSDDEYGSVDRVDGAASAEPVDQADRWEQQRPVPEARRRHPHDRFEAG